MSFSTPAGGEGVRRVNVTYEEPQHATRKQPITNIRLSLVQASAAGPEADAQECTASPLIPSSVVSPLRPSAAHGAGHGHRNFEAANREADDPASDAVLIYPRRIDDLFRFRVLYAGLLLFIVSSMQGVHALFGVLLMEQQYRYTVEQMTNIYICGAAFGMFVFPFGVMYDWFGPRPVVVIGSVLVLLANLLLGLMFYGKINHTVTNAAVFYAMMSWGCYALDVAVLPAVLTHMPRDRGQPTGLLKTFSGLGASFLSCLYRGFFTNRFDHLMWFMVVLTAVIGIIGTVYVRDAPYVVTRWQQRRLTPRKQLRCHLIRNRYMSQLLPKPRFMYCMVILVVLNIYFTIQAVCAAYLQAKMTPGKYRGMAIGAIVITLSTCILAIPVRAIDGASPQDERVIAAAKEKEARLQELKQQRRERDAANRHIVDAAQETETSYCAGDAGRAHEDSVTVLQPEAERPLVEVDVSECDEAAAGDGAAQTTAVRVDAAAENAPAAQTPPSQLVQVRVHAPSTYDNPYVETITLSGEVFVVPVYQTSFLQSLTYIDLWLMFFTTMFVWGVGLTLTANWNIEVMLSARYAPTDYKLYILFASLSGVETAGGRVFIGVYEKILNTLRERFNIVVTHTVAYSWASVGLFLSMILWIALPASKTLVIVYIFGPFFYGLSTSMTVYVLGIIFERDLGMHYGFCFLGAAIGMVLCFRLAWFIPYDQNAVMIPFVGKRCIGQRKCMNKTVGVYLVFTFISIFTSYFVHFRYNRLVRGKLRRRRVIVPVLRRAFTRGEKEERRSELSRPHSPFANDESRSAEEEGGNVLAPHTSSA